MGLWVKFHFHMPIEVARMCEKVTGVEMCRQTVIQTGYINANGSKTSKPFKTTNIFTMMQGLQAQVRHN